MAQMSSQKEAPKNSWLGRSIGSLSPKATQVCTICQSPTDVLEIAGC